MLSSMGKHLHTLYTRFPPSSPCSCQICTYFCSRPGWWLVQEARLAIEHGLANRMMLEFSPDISYAVLSPAFKGNEGYFSLQAYAGNNCTFLIKGKCEIFKQDFQPIECRFCHHGRMGEGPECHTAIAHDWNSSKGKRLVRQWLEMQNLHLPFSIQLP